jgi:hypothetical protein
MRSRRCSDEIWCYRFRLISFDDFHYGVTIILFSTFVTPGAHHAALSASWRSAHDRTVPLRMISLPLVSTVMRLASNSALRRKASLDPALDLHGRNPRLDLDRVGDALDPSHAPNCLLGSGPLVVPLHLAFERQPAALDDHPYPLPRVWKLALDLGDGVAGDLGIWSFVNASPPRIARCPSGRLRCRSPRR